MHSGTLQIYQGPGFIVKGRIASGRSVASGSTRQDDMPLFQTVIHYLDDIYMQRALS